MSWANVQQQQQFQLWSAPTGWVGSWPPTAPAGYPGPPPVPAGVNPQAWTAGRWQFNPMFRGPVPQTGGQPGVPAWAPHPSWGPQAASAYAAAAAAANYHPYKRQPNPGDRDYWSTKLVDNPLGLENMHIRDTEHKKTRENGVMHTPWVWVPKELSESPEHRGSTDLPSGGDRADGVDGRDRRDGRGSSRAQDTRVVSREPSRSRPPSTADASTSSRYPQDRYGSAYGSSASARDVAAGQPHDRPEPRQRYDSTTARSPRDPSRTRTEGLTAEPNVVPPPPPTMPSGYSSYSSYSQQHQRQRSRDVSPRPADTSQPRSSPNPPTSSASASAAAAATSGRQTGAPSATEAFSSRQQLHPTFSPSIVRTPKHYTSASAGTPTRRSTTDDSHSTSAHSRRSSGEPSAPSTVTTPSRRLSSDDAHYPSSSTPTTRRSTQEDSNRGGVSPGHHQHGPIYAPPTASASNTPSRSNSLSKRRSSAPTPSSGSPTSAAAPLPYLASFSEEPEGILSPLVTAPRSLTGGPSPREPSARTAGTPSGGRELGRSSTYPSFSASATFESIPEERAVPQPHSQARTPKPQERNRYSDPESTPYANARSPSRSSHASPEAGPQKMTRSVTYPMLDERQSAHAQTSASYTSSRSPPTHTQPSYASSRSPTAQPSSSYTSSRSPPTNTSRSPNPPGRSPTAQPRSPTEPSYSSHSRSQSQSREPSRSRGPSPTRNSRGSHNPLPRPPMPSNYPTVSSASTYSSGTRTAAAYPSSTQQASTYPTSAQPASTYSSSTQPTSTHHSRTQSASHQSSSTQPSSTYSSAPQSSSAYASHKQSTSSYSSGAHHTPSAYASASTYSSTPTPQPSGHSPSSRKVRKGYWNRRGDHLVYDQNRWCIVYAPRTRANPPELSHYPSPVDGFMDHHGQKAKYDPNVPELPESLPLHGEPPKRPYHEFVQYVHV
ncbi:hypothetical protein DAEQUDRAFT_305168 [Daedalea quercina L-15889]|uniref:Uncharacterized protein n=1 Tax=Daedalea quercina L-15889 TaxID=1314783 RepID=A0A165Q1B9_9APHY|nr:hypothetical protein DAEQUDRAFT_305168 [Daedalea quercina L-15889]